jgi:hypothetical protein
MKTRKIYHSVNVVFKENEFPYQKALKEQAVFDDSTSDSEASSNEADADVEVEVEAAKACEKDELRKQQSNVNTEVTVVREKPKSSDNVEVLIPVFKTPAKRLMKAAEESEDEEKTPSHSHTHHLRQRKEKLFMAFVVEEDYEGDGVHEELSMVMLNDPDAPSVKEALEEREKDLWFEAMGSEIDQLKDQGTFTLVKLPPNRRAIPYKWVLKRKRNECNEITKYKARLTAGGHRQQEGIDYKETFAPVSRISSIRILLTIALNENMVVKQLDVTGAYLNGVLKEEVYMKQPSEFLDKDQPTYVWKLHKALYGLKQAGMEWYNVINSFLTSIGFTRLEIEWGIYVKILDTLFTLMILFSVDILNTKSRKSFNKLPMSSKSPEAKIYVGSWGLSLFVKMTSIFSPKANTLLRYWKGSRHTLGHQETHQVPT